MSPAWLDRKRALFLGAHLPVLWHPVSHSHHVASLELGRVTAHSPGREVTPCREVGRGGATGLPLGLCLFQPQNNRAPAVRRFAPPCHCVSVLQDSERCGSFQRQKKPWCTGSQDKILEDHKPKLTGNNFLHCGERELGHTKVAMPIKQ